MKRSEVGEVDLVAIASAVAAAAAIVAALKVGYACLTAGMIRFSANKQPSVEDVAGSVVWICDQCQAKFDGRQGLKWQRRCVVPSDE